MRPGGGGGGGGGGIPLADGGHADDAGGWPVAVENAEAGIIVRNVECHAIEADLLLKVQKGDK
jgi:hypothetical protein